MTCFPQSGATGICWRSKSRSSQARPSISRCGRGSPTISVRNTIISILPPSVLSPENVPAVNVQTVADFNTARRPVLPGAGRLYRVTAFSESHPEDQVPRLRVEAEAQVDPIFNLEAVSIT